MAAAKKDDLGQAEAQKHVEEAEDKGFIGVKVDPLPNSAHSLQSGPDAPSIVEQQATALEQRAQAARDSSAGKGA